MYQAQLVSDQTPFDRYAEGQSDALTPQQQIGQGLFWGKGKCANCHGGPAFTNAAIRGQSTPEIMSSMIIGSGARAVYDEGFYNITVTPTTDDVGLGGTDPFGNPLSFSAVARLGSATFARLEALTPNLTLRSTERIAVNGAFKTPGLRNVALTAPYFHNGSASSLMQVVEFYNRGGNFVTENSYDRDADIRTLGLDQEEKLALVAFMESLTDQRVLKHAAPFDHPELRIPNGHAGDTQTVTSDGQGRAVDTMLTIPAVGAAGYAPGAAPLTFLGLFESRQMANLAAGKPAVQSSTVVPNYASRAVDGNVDGMRSRDSLAITTLSTNPWWQVDLGAVSQLSLIEIWNRIDSTTDERLKNFVIFVSDTDMSSRTYEELLADSTVARTAYSGVPPTNQIEVAPPRPTGRFVRLQLPARVTLNIAEVRVYGR